MLRNGAHRNDVMIGAQSDVQLIADLELLRALGALAIHFDLAGLDGGYSERPGFKKARCP